jgi:DNA-binding response OmpR family regulator
MRILVVEDQRKMAEFVRKGLNEIGYNVDLAETGGAAEAMAADNPYDLIVLDVMLPDQNGFDTARHLRSDGFANPILMLTAVNSTKDKVNGLDAGADDYLTKPFEFDELLARVRALLRRKNSAEKIPILRFSDVEMDLTTRKVTRSGQSITLTTKEFALLEYLMRHATRPVTRTAISEHVWDIHFDTESNVIDVYINMLRKKIDTPFEKKLIHTVVGYGYVLKET